MFDERCLAPYILRRSHANGIIGTIVEGIADAFEQDESIFHGESEGIDPRRRLSSITRSHDIHEEIAGFIGKKGDVPQSAFHISAKFINGNPLCLHEVGTDFNGLGDRRAEDGTDARYDDLVGARLVTTQDRAAFNDTSNEIRSIAIT